MQMPSLFKDEIRGGGVGGWGDGLYIRDQKMKSSPRLFGASNSGCTGTTPATAIHRMEVSDQNSQVFSVHRRAARHAYVFSPSLGIFTCVGGSLSQDSRQMQLPLRTMLERGEERSHPTYPRRSFHS
jgi:hypothetical protein